MDADHRGKAAEGGLREQDAGHYRMLFDTMADGVVFVAPDGRILQANAAALRMMRLSRTAFESRNCNDSAWVGLRPDGTPRPHAERAIQRAFQERRTVSNVEMGVRRDDGTVCWINSSAAPLINDAGEVEGVVASFTDISECREAQDLLRLQRDLVVAVLAEDSLEGALQKVLEFACRIPGVDGGGVYHVDGTSGQADLLAHRGLGMEFVAAVDHVPPGSGRARALLQGQPLYVVHDAMRGIDPEGVLAREGLRALAVMPQQFEGRVVAALNLASHTVDDFAPASRLAIEAVAGLMGGAVTHLDAQDAVRQARQNLATLFDTITDMLFILDESGRILHANRAALQALGYTAEELLQRSVLDLHPPERREEVGAVVADMVAGRCETCRIPLVSRSGQLVEVETKVHLGQWDGGRVLFGVSRDISERLRMEHEVIRAKEDWERTFDAVPDLIALLDTDHRITRVNRAMAERLGYAPAQLAGRRCYEVLHGLSAPPACCPHAQVLLSGKQAHAEIAELQLGGIFDVTVAPLHDKSGSLVGSVHVAHDITASKQAMLALQKSEEKFRELVESINDVLYSVDMQGRIAYISPAVEPMLGHTTDELLGTPYVPFVHPDDLAEFQASYADAMAGRSRHAAYRLRHKDGTYRWVRSSSRLVLDAAGQVVAMRGMLRDVTEKREVEQALREREAVLAKAQQIAHLGSWELDDATHELRWSDETFRIFGYAPQTFSPTIALFLQSVHPEDRTSMQEAITAAWDARTPFSRDHRIVLPDGAERIVHEQAEIMRNASGEPVKWMGTVQDITERRLAEELFRGVFENNPTAIQVLDENGFTLRVNAAHTRLFGAVLPADFSIFDDLSRRPALRKLVLRAKCGNVTRFPDMEYNVHDVGPELPNKPIWVRATVFPIDSAGGRQQRFVMMHQDITDARRMEGEILQIADWEKTRIGQDLHDTLGQQLAGLAYLIQALVPAWAKQPQAVTNKALAQLADEAGRSVNLVRQVARGLTPVAPTPNGLANALRDMAERVQQIHGMTCVLQADEEVTVTSRLAATHLLRIAQESVTNAVRHGRARHVAVGLKRRGERGELTIQDDGVGMPAGHPAGPGLGLRIMHYRAAQIGATLAVERVEGGGTRVVCGFRYLGDAET